MLTLAAYESRSQASNQFSGKVDALDQLRYGFFGEIGGLLSAVKKSNRELGPKQKDTVLEELGDALWYLTTIGGEYKLSLEILGKAALVDLQNRLGVQQERAEIPITFLELDGLITLCYGKLPESQNCLLQELAAATGKLFTPEICSTVPGELLGTLLADIIMVAAIFNIKINEIAEQNLKKLNLGGLQIRLNTLTCSMKKCQIMNSFLEIFRFILSSGNSMVKNLSSNKLKA